MLVNTALHTCDIDIKHRKKVFCECLNPRFIVNKNLSELISKFGLYYFHGHFYRDYRKWKIFYHLDLKPFNSYLPYINSSNYDENVVIDESTGEMYPIYLCVPCGHCDLCLEKKQKSFVNRIKYESFMYPYQPIFVTLTYNDDNLPSNGVSVRDCQLFLKRFRQRLIRSGYSERIRYALVAEYGTKATRRPHYHAIFFGLPVSSPNDLFRIESILGKSWSNGFVLSRQIDMSDNHTAYYTSKYIRKKQSIPKGANDVFCISSRGHGGLGSSFFSKQAKMLRKRVQRKFDVLNPWTHKVEPFMWSSYALDKIYPSEKKYIPYKLRKHLTEYCKAVNAWKHTYPELFWLFETNYNAIKKKFGGYIYMPFDMSLEDMHVKDLDCAGNIYEHEREVLKYMVYDFSDVKKIAQQREFLMSNLNTDRAEFDLVQKLVTIRRNNKRLAKYEKL